MARNPEQGYLRTVKPVFESDVEYNLFVLLCFLSLGWDYILETEVLDGILNSIQNI